MSKINFSVDDGCQSDLRLALLLEKYNKRMTIYLPIEWQRLAYENGYLPMTFGDVSNLVDRGHKLGAHTISHRHLTKLDKDDQLIEIIHSKSILEAMFFRPITSFCPPRGYTNDDIDEIVFDNYIDQRLTKGPHIVHIHPDSGANGNKPWQDRVNEDTTELWCHSWELDKYNLWEELERWLSENSNR